MSDLDPQQVARSLDAKTGLGGQQGISSPVSLVVVFGFCHSNFFWSNRPDLRNHIDQVVLCGMLSECGKGSVEGVEDGQKTKTTPDAGGK